MSKVVHYAGENFENETLVKSGVTLVDFFATWCGPCQMLGPVLDELSNSADYKIVKVDVDQANELAVQFGVRSVPTMVIFKDGQPVETLVGFMTQDEIDKKVQAYK